MTDMNSHLARIRGGLEHFALLNHEPAIEEPANPFEEAVNAHDLLVRLQDELKLLIRKLNEDEREQRDGIADSLRSYFGEKLKEGMNNYPLSNRRKLKFNNKVDRKVDEAQFAVARAAYEEAGPEGGATQVFDGLFRVKYELNKTNWKKLAAGTEAATAVSRCLVTKFSAPEIEVD